MESHKFTEEFCGVWNSGHDAIWHLVPQLFADLAQGQEWVRYDLSPSSFGPLWSGRATQAGIRNGLSAKTLWLVSAELLSGSKFGEASDHFLDLAKKEGLTRWQWGGDEFHFIAGVPLRAAAKEDPYGREFGGALAVDYLGDLGNPLISKFTAEHPLELPWVWQSVVTEDHQECLMDFLKQEFSGRWSREFAFWRCNRRSSAAQWFTASQVGEGVSGFARLCIRGKAQNYLQVPAALRLPLGDEGICDTDACLGPIGISKQERGKGLGSRLLAAALAELRSQGGRKLCIDWTDAYNFYDPLGLEARRRYRTLWRDL
jgi:GNAT superfamily N-acetyltransferase